MDSRDPKRLPPQTQNNARLIMDDAQLKAILATIATLAFGLFLIWQGVTGNVVKSAASKPILPRWIYIVSGVGLLILPIAYLVALLAS